MTYIPPNPNGQATMANSSPVTLASDQTAIPVTATNLDVQSGGADLATSTQAGAIQTAVELLDDTVATLGTTTYTEATNKAVTIGAVRRDANTTLVSATNEVAPLQVNATGELKVAVIQAIPTVTTVTTVTNITNQGMGADDSAFTPATTRVMTAGFFADETATDSVDEGDMGAARMTLDRKQIVANYAHTAGGATPYKLVSAASTNATNVKNGAGQVYMITASNVNAAARYLKMYNKASAPTVGTDVPVHTFIIPGNTAGAGTNIPVPTVGINFSTGISFALTTEATDAGTTGVALSEIVVNLAYL